MKGNGNMIHRNARFWIFINDAWVKLTLKPDQRLSWYRKQCHEEGWASNYEVWSHDGDRVSRIEEECGIDCDGRLDLHYSRYCYIENLAKMECDGYMIPEWVSCDSSQRDYTAERAGY